MKTPLGHLVLLQLPFAVVISVLLLSLRCNAANQSAYRFRQNGRVTGFHVVYLSKRGVQVENLATRAVVVSTAPDWQLFLYNKGKGNYFVLKDASQFKGCFANSYVRTAGDDASKFSWRRLSSQRFCGLNADRFYTEDRNSEAHAVRGMEADTAIRMAELIVAHEDLMPARIADAICRLYSVPSLHKFPLQFLYSRDGKNFRPGLQSAAFERISDRPDLFARPKGLKLASGEQEVMTGEVPL